MKTWTEESIKTERIESLFYWLKQYAIEAKEDYRNGESYQIEIERIEREIMRRINKEG